MDRTDLLYYAGLAIAWFIVGQATSGAVPREANLFLIAILGTISLYFVYVEYQDWRQGRGNA